MSFLPKSIPIRWHLLVFAVLILVPQVAVGLALGISYASSERLRVEASASSIAVAVRSQLDRELEAMKAALQALATSPNVEAGDFGALREQSLTLLKFRGSAIAVRDRGHQQVMNTLVAYGTPLPVSRDPALVAADKRVFASGEPAVSDLYVGAVSRKPFVLVDVPLLRGGEIRYAMNMAIEPTVIRDLLANSRLPAGWIATILDGSDRVIARSSEHAAFVGHPAPRSFTDAAKGRSGTVDGVTALDGTPVFTAYDTLDTSRWRVAISVPNAVLSAPTRRVALTVMAIVLTALATSALLARFYSVRLDRQVRGLVEMAGTIGTTDHAERRPYNVTELESIGAALHEADISLKARERHKDLLLAELNHRVRNTLSVLLSVVNQTIRGSSGQEDLARKTVGRIMALSRAHDLLSSAEWAPIALSSLVARTAEHERLAIAYEGPELMLRPEAVAPMAQALHELAVNQRAHGAAAEQEVWVRTGLSGDQVRLEWESPGSVSVTPWTSGFGLRLVRLCLERQLFGTIERMGPSGLCATLPIDFLTSDGNVSEPFAARWKQGRSTD